MMPHHLSIGHLDEEKIVSKILSTRNSILVQIGGCRDKEHTILFPHKVSIIEKDLTDIN